LDCCDRINYSLEKAGKHSRAVDIELMIQEGLLAVLETNLPGPLSVTILHDNGPEFIEKILKKSPEIRNIEDCNTPTYLHNPMECVNFEWYI